MKFEENLRELRKQYGLSQEELAERLEVSRQSVSKWENGSASPELEKLLQLCELFHCTLDDLIKGEVKEKPGLNKETYDKEKNLEILLVCIGVGLIILGFALYCILDEIWGNEKAELSNGLFMIFVLIGVTCFVMMGIKASFFEKRYPHIPLGLYSETEIQQFEQRFSIGITVGVALCIFAVVLQQFTTAYVNEVYGNALFLFVIAIAVCILIYFGMNKGKYDKTQYVEVKSETDEKGALISGIIMICATGIFLIWSFLFDAWEVSWLAFVIGGLSCGIVWLWIKGKDYFQHKD